MSTEILFDFNKQTRILAFHTYPESGTGVTILDNGDDFLEVIYIRSIEAKIQPKIKIFQCLCCKDGLVHYDNGPLELRYGSRALMIDSIDAYRCNNCDFSAHIPQVDISLRQKIDSIPQEAFQIPQDL